MMMHRALSRANRRIGTGSALPKTIGTATPLIVRFSSASAPVSVASGSFWRGLIPKPLRRENRQSSKGKTKEANPMTFFIIMFLFIGSMSIQLLALRHQTERYMRQSSLRIAQLREVVKRIQDGEDVDVEGALGTGDPQREAEWEEVLQAIEQDEAMRKPSKEKATESDTEVKPASEQEPAKKANFAQFF